MTKFSQKDGIDDELTDTIGILAKKLQACQSRNHVYSELRAQLEKAIKAKKYLSFVANVTNYGTWTIGHSKLFYVPKSRRGALSFFRGKTIRIVCIGSGRFTRLLAAAVVKVDTHTQLTAVKQFEFNQKEIAQEKSQKLRMLQKVIRDSQSHHLATQNGPEPNRRPKADMLNMRLEST